MVSVGILYITLGERCISAVEIRTQSNGKTTVVEAFKFVTAGQDRMGFRTSSRTWARSLRGQQAGLIESTTTETTSRRTASGRRAQSSRGTSDARVECFRPTTREDPITLFDHEALPVFETVEPSGFVEEQLANQIKTYGRDPADMRGEERAQYLRDMTLALTEELHEILRENSWKPWHRGRDGYGELSRGLPSEAAKRAIEDEMGDVLCFLGNLARVHGLTTEDVIAGHRRKLELNAERHADQAALGA